MNWREELTIAIIKCKYVISKKGPKGLWISHEVSKTIKDIKKKKEWNFKSLKWRKFDANDLVYI